LHEVTSFLLLLFCHLHYSNTVNERARKQIQSGQFGSRHFGSNKSKPSNSRILSISRVNSFSKTKVGPDSSPKSSVMGNTEISHLNLSDRKVIVSARFANTLSPVRRPVNVLGGLNDSEELSNGLDDIEKNMTGDAEEGEEEGDGDGDVEVTSLYSQSNLQYACLDSDSPKYSPDKNFPNIEENLALASL
jgi:hypothetical protein